ncbi:hypothetical protein EJB05_45372, partial [Eragrostis curvula]
MDWIDLVTLVLVAWTMLYFAYDIYHCVSEMLAMDQQEESSLDEGAARASEPLPPLILPCFPYEAEPGRASSETVLCAICLEELRQGELCSEVPVCQHVFHRDCLGMWTRSNGSCPLCRTKIVLGSYRYKAAFADDMV